jgi:hypothetical protein
MAIEKSILEKQLKEEFAKEDKHHWRLLSQVKVSTYK